MLINDEDCDISPPSSIEDRYIGIGRNPLSTIAHSGLAMIIPVVRCLAEVRRTLRSSYISPNVLQSFDERFYQVLAFSESHKPDSQGYLDPDSLPFVLLLQETRFQLSRHNISPVCQTRDRIEALRRCASVAKDTERYILRTTLPLASPTESDKAWHVRVGMRASNMICMHIWRCMLILCFDEDYEAASTCLRLASAIGDRRKVNRACGRNLLFFLQRLQERIVNGNGSRHLLDNDEEMLAYVSGDMQGSTEHSWAWEATSTVGTIRPSSSSEGQRTLSPEAAQSAYQAVRSNTGSQETEAGEWDGWNRIERLIHQLMEERRARASQPPYYPQPHNPVKRLQLAPDRPVSAPAPSPAVPSPTTPVNTSRMSIANII